MKTFQLLSAVLLGSAFCSYHSLVNALDEGDVTTKIDGALIASENLKSTWHKDLEKLHALGCLTYVSPLDPAYTYKALLDGAEGTTSLLLKVEKNEEFKTQILDILSTKRHDRLDEILLHAVHTVDFNKMGIFPDKVSNLITMLHQNRRLQEEYDILFQNVELAGKPDYVAYGFQESGKPKGKTVDEVVRKLQDCITQMKNCGNNSSASANAKQNFQKIFKDADTALGKVTSATDKKTKLEDALKIINDLKTKIVDFIGNRDEEIKKAWNDWEATEKNNIQKAVSKNIVESRRAILRQFLKTILSTSGSTMATTHHVAPAPTATTPAGTTPAGTAGKPVADASTGAPKPDDVKPKWYKSIGFILGMVALGLILIGLGVFIFMRMRRARANVL